jgi:hypothetical protein
LFFGVGVAAGCWFRCLGRVGALAAHARVSGFGCFWAVRLLLVDGLLERGVSLPLPRVRASWATIGSGWVVTGVIGDFVWLILLENLVGLGG